MARDQATLALASQDDTTASFTAEYLKKGKDGRYNLWVALNGYDAGSVHRSATFAPLVWDEDHGTVTVSKSADPDHPIAGYRACVVAWPDVWDAVSNEVNF